MLGDFQIDRYMETYMVGKSETHWLCSGQPSATSPVPPYTVYWKVPRSCKGVEVILETKFERRDGTGAPEMRVGRLPAAKS
jgi:hypothetical protein